MNEPSLRRSPWIAPALLGFGSAFALIAALAADGVWDWISWLLLLLPLLTVGWAFFRK
jgi:hypothetical protein